MVWLRRKAADFRLFAAMGVAGALLRSVDGERVASVRMRRVSRSSILHWQASVGCFARSGCLRAIRDQILGKNSSPIDYDQVMGNWRWVASVDRPEFAGLERPPAPVRRGRRILILTLRSTRKPLNSSRRRSCIVSAWRIGSLARRDVRFGSGYLAAAGILGLSIACAAYFGRFHSSDFARRLTIEAIVVSMLIGAAALTKFGNTWKVKDPPAFVMMTAPGGKPVWIPQVVDQCWDHQLPCTPYFNGEALQRVRWR